MTDGWKRVKDKTTGHEYTRWHVDPKRHEVIDKPAVDDHGNPLPAKPNVLGKRSSAPSTGSVEQKAASPAEKGK